MPAKPTPAEPSTRLKDASFDAAGGSVGFEQLYRAYVPRVFKYMYSHTGNRQDAEELTAQTFLVALERLPGYQENGLFPAWLFAIARNKAADFFRRRGRRPETDLDESLPANTDIATQSLQSSDIHTLVALLHSLPSEQRELLRLRFVADLSFAEIAALQGRKQDAVKKTLYRLLKRLQTRLESQK